MKNKTTELTEHQRQKAKIFRKNLNNNYMNIIGKLPWEKSIVGKLGVGYDILTKRLTFLHIDQNRKLINIKWHKGPNGEDPYSISGHGENRLYPLHMIESYKQSYLIICQGEKDVVTLLSHGYEAITSTLEAGKIPKDLTSLKPYERIAILLDNDKAGIKGSEKLAAAIKKVYPGKTVEIIHWPIWCPEGFDITDYFQHHPAEEFDQILEDVKNNRKAYEIMNAEEFEKQPFYIPEPIVEEILTERGVGTIAGPDGVGKSILALQFGISCALGVPFMDYKTLKPVRVLMLQFEMENGEEQFRYNKIKRWFDENYPEPPGAISNLNFMIIKEDTQLFTDQWKTIEKTLKESKIKYDVLIVDNLYSSTEKNVSANHELAPLLGKMTKIRRKNKLAMMLVNHHTKGQAEAVTLNKDMIRGGKSFTDWLTNAVQMGESAVSQDLRVFKVTKLRSGEGHTLNIPQALKFDSEHLIFKRIGPIENETMHFSTKEPRPEFEAYEKINSVAVDGKFTTEQFESVLEDMNYKRASVYRWLNKMKKWKMIKSIGHGEYQIIESEMNKYNNKS
jgi:hypothetical protein